ncbi:MAG: FtsX-like permease family protein [Acidobacteria bacterium]|nr:FtsX-like permease family protein [Acidobacteriota bacterium]
MSGSGGRTRYGARRQLLPDLELALQNLSSRKLRSFLTMLGMIFGVGAVVSMLSIGAGAQQQVLAFIEQLGVKNLIVEAKELTTSEELVQIRRLSPGLSFKDLRVINANVGDVQLSSARKRFTPTSLLPKPRLDMPAVHGVGPDYEDIAGLRVVAGRFFSSEDNELMAPVCVLGEGAKANLFPQREAVGEMIKIHEQWMRVIGVLGPRLNAQNDLSGLKKEDLNNLIYVPINTVIYRLEDNRNRLADEIDGLYLQVGRKADVGIVAETIRGILDTSHRNAADYSLIIPAELLAEQKRTQRIFEMVMVAIASISLLVGGIGIMNIMLATILERTHEIGVRRAVGARKRDVLSQFLVEAVLISFVGGLLGVGCGFGLSRLVALMAGWSTIVTMNSILLAFLVSVSVGLVFGIYPAAKAARLDPVEALRHE